MAGDQLPLLPLMADASLEKKGVRVQDPLGQGFAALPYFCDILQLDLYLVQVILRYLGVIRIPIVMGALMGEIHEQRDSQAFRYPERLFEIPPVLRGNGEIEPDSYVVLLEPVHRLHDPVIGGSHTPRPVVHLPATIQGEGDGQAMRCLFKDLSGHPIDTVREQSIGRNGEDGRGVELGGSLANKGKVIPEERLSPGEADSLQVVHVGRTEEPPVLLHLQLLLSQIRVFPVPLPDGAHGTLPIAPVGDPEGQPEDPGGIGTPEQELVTAVEYLPSTEPPHDGPLLPGPGQTGYRYAPRYIPWPQTHGLPLPQRLRYLCDP